MKVFAFTLDLEADYAGLLNQYEIFKQPERIKELLKLFRSFDVKLTVFTVGEIFEQYPEIIKLFEKYDCEFEVHSYSHRLKDPNSEEEIIKSQEAYCNYFKKNPLGYRAPRGRIKREAINLLEKHSFLYDSSIFPSYFPNPFKYLFCNRSMHSYNNSSIIEIPITSITPLRLTLSISYMKLLGFNFYRLMFYLFGLPKLICFDSHLHDFIYEEKSYKKLPWFWKFVYGRNKYSGLDYCEFFLRRVKQQGFQFLYMSEVYSLHKNSFQQKEPNASP